MFTVNNSELAINFFIYVKNFANLTALMMILKRVQRNTNTSNIVQLFIAKYLF